MVGAFFLCLLISVWFTHKATQHRKDPDQVFYLGNVNKAGRKYVWLSFLSLLAALIVFSWPGDH